VIGAPLPRRTPAPPELAPRNTPVPPELGPAGPAPRHTPVPSELGPAARKTPLPPELGPAGPAPRKTPVPAEMTMMGTPTSPIAVARRDSQPTLSAADSSPAEWLRDSQPTIDAAELDRRAAAEDAADSGAFPVAVEGDELDEALIDPPDEPIIPEEPIALAGVRAGSLPRAETRSPKPSQATSLLSPDMQFPAPPEREPSVAPVRTPRKPIEIGENTQIDRFGLIREIARGGMGQVFLARDTKLGRKVAIKFLLHDDPNFAQRFLIEARATARCTHENIVAIYEVGEHEGLPYMVLEYLEGKTLSQALDAKPGPKQFAEIMLSVARALERAHEHGIVHRDLKPSNIFVTDRGQVKVLDFGVARIFDAVGDQMEQAAASSGKSHNKWESDSGDRNTYVTFSGGGTMVGTLPYMSPEQWGADNVDHQSDLWACGIMFWRALTGVHPAGTMNADKLRTRLTDLDTPLPSIGSRDPLLPRELVALVDKCLEKHKSRRFQNAAELIVAIQAFLAPKSERVTEDQSPYRGLAAFGEADAKYFFGRSNEIRTAQSLLDAWPLLAVIGPSGVGKSSFVHAGLVPAVRGTGGNWQVRVLRPGRSPLQSLATTLDETIDTGTIAGDIVDQLHDGPGLYGELLRKAAIRKKHKVLIVVDQLEELFTLSDNDEVRKLFLAALLAAADDVTSPVRVVLSMRADFLDRLAGHKHFLNELSRGLFFLSAPDADNLRETLVRPAELAGYTFGDSWIVEDMMQAATSKGALPLLQFAATRLWDARDRAKKQLTITAYNAMGGVGGAFARHADEVAAAVPASSQRLLRAIMTRLVTPEGTRAVVDRDELLGLSDDRTEIERILDQLIRARLVLMHTDAVQGTTVEIVHEVLISEWPTLARWLEDSQALRGFLADLRQATKQWIARNKAADLVWRGATAQDALATIKRHVVELSSSEVAFLDAARSELARGRKRKIAVVASVLAVLVLIIAGGSYFTIKLSRANGEAQDAVFVAEKAAKAAKAAEAKVQAQLDEVKAAQAEREKAMSAREKAEQAAAAAGAEATKANEQVALSQEELQKANAELQAKFLEAEKAKAIAQDLAKKAALAKDLAEKATEDAKAANAKTQALLAAERERVKKLEAEKSKISTGGLQ
jgi:serine/threonine protein kinase